MLLRIPLHYLSGKNWLNGVEFNAMTGIKVARLLSEVSGRVADFLRCLINILMIDCESSDHG